jgi:hypothetical protein
MPREEIRARFREVLARGIEHADQEHREHHLARLAALGRGARDRSLSRRAMRS